MQDRKFSILGNLDLIVAGAIFCVLVIVTFMGVVMRYLLSDPLHWTEEVQLGCFLWLTFAGAGAAFRYGSHVAVEIVYELFSPRVRRLIDLFNYLVMMLLFGYCAFLSAELVQIMYNLNKATYILQIPTWIINLVVPLSCVSMMVSVTIAEWQRLKQQGPSQSKE